MHSEGFPGGEMKHGPIALIDKKSLTICLSPNNELYEKSISNAEEIFLTGSAVEVTPVGKIDDQIFKVGDITTKISSLYMKEVDPNYKDS